MMQASRPFKILFLGAMAVGKSSLIRRMTLGTFSTDYKSTLGVQLHEIEVTGSFGPQKAVLWDTDGEAEEAIVDSPYARGADAALIVCDAARPETARTLLDIADAFEERLPGRPFMGVVNKIDLVPPDHDLIARIEAACDVVALTSALTGQGCEDALKALVALTVDRMDDL